MGFRNELPRFYVLPVLTPTTTALREGRAERADYYQGAGLVELALTEELTPFAAFLRS